MFDEMTNEEFRTYHRAICHLLAVQEYHREHPNCTFADVWKYASRHWREWEEQALDYMAYVEIRLENEMIARERLN